MSSARQEYLYMVAIDQGSSHPEFSKFLVNVSDLGGMSPDFSITRIAFVSSRNSIEIFRRQVGNRIRNKRALTVEEVTTATVIGDHRTYIGTIKKFAAYKDYPRIDLRKAEKAIQREHDGCE